MVLGAFSGGASKLERTEGESELSHLARFAAGILEGVQGIGDWGHESDGEGIELDLLSESHYSMNTVFPVKL